jgi:hypothetical protein
LLVASGQMAMRVYGIKDRIGNKATKPARRLETSLERRHPQSGQGFLERSAVRRR